MKKPFIFFLVSALAIFSACRKSDRDLDDSTHTTKDHMKGEAVFNDIFFLVHEAAINSEGLSSAASGSIATLKGCDTVTVDTNSSPMTLTIDFDHSKCDGRSGKIFASFSGKYDKTNSSTTITFQSYQFNEIRVFGEIKLVNQGQNPQGETKFSFGTTNTEMQYDNTIMEWYSNRTLYWAEGTSTFGTVNDDLFVVEENVTGRTFKGNSYYAETSENLSISPDCTWPYAGRLEVKPENLDVRMATLSAACSDNIVITIHGKDYEESLEITE